MKVKIKTPNGFMTVDLAEFLPTSKAKIRKLFRLMEQGIDAATKKSVREYLSGLKKTDRLDLITAMEKEWEKRLMDIDMELERLNDEKIQLKRDLAKAKKHMRAEQLIQASADEWIREFCYYVGYVEDTDVTE